MPTAVSFIPVFAVITLLLGGTNELSNWLILVGILSINIHATLPPADPSSPFPNFDNYHPQQPPFRDYILVFGLASLMLVALISRTHRLVIVSVVSHLNRSLTLHQGSDFRACHPEEISRTSNHHPSQFVLRSPGISPLLVEASPP